MFLYDFGTKKLLPAGEMRTRESIICGQSNGYIDTISCRPSKKNKFEYRLDNVDSKFCSQMGYINCI